VIGCVGVSAPVGDATLGEHVAAEGEWKAPNSNAYCRVRFVQTALGSATALYPAVHLAPLWKPTVPPQVGAVHAHALHPRVSESVA
jgi:hypothetical protein